jgi:hypothetical protein
MNPTKTGLYSTYADDRFIFLYWDGEDWVDQDGIRPCYKKVQWTSKPLFVPALRTWVGLTDEERKDALVSVDAETKRLPPGMTAFARAIEAKLKDRNNGP